MQWVVATAAFLASAVEFVEAFTIVLVVGVTVNWRSALLGALAAAATLALLVATLGVALVQWVPLDILRTVIGTLLLLFGLKWLKNAIMRYAGLKAHHDEEAIYEETQAELRARGAVDASSSRFNLFGFLLSYKSVLLEGLEVAFIVITFGLSASTSTVSRSSGIASAALGALLEWPVSDVFLLILAAIYLVASFLLIAWLKQVKKPQQAPAIESQSVPTTAQTQEVNP